MPVKYFRIMLAIACAAFLSLSSAVYAADEDDDAPPLDPVVGQTTDDEFDYDEDQDTPLEPEKGGKRGYKYGAILEFWLMEPGRKFVRMPSEPSLTGMIDDLRESFAGKAMQRDKELKNYAARQGVLQWTTYFRARKPGKHVFLVTPAGVGFEGVEHSGVALAFNDEVKAVTPGDREASAVVDFGAPGLYKMQVRLWWTNETRANFTDMDVGLKVREPGSLSLRAMNRKEFYYKVP